MEETSDMDENHISLSDKYIIKDSIFWVYFEGKSIFQTKSRKIDIRYHHRIVVLWYYHYCREFYRTVRYFVVPALTRKSKTVCILIPKRKGLGSLTFLFDVCKSNSNCLWGVTACFRFVHVCSANVAISQSEFDVTLPGWWNMLSKLFKICAINH